MSTKFEQLLDLIVNEEMDKANELFHSIVVEKSREIYENLIAEEEQDETDMDVEESMEDEDVEEGMADEDMDESEMDLEDSYVADGEEDSHDFAPGDATDDLGADTMDMGDEEDMGGEEGEDAAIMDIKNAIADLEAAFAELEAAQGGEEPHGDFGDEMDDEEGDKETDEMMMGQPAFEGKRMTREYVEKVGNDWDKNSMKSQGQHVAAGTGDKEGGPAEGKSPIASGSNKPGPAGVNAKNLVQGASEQAPDGTSPKGKAGGLVKNPQTMSTGNQNVPGGKVSVKGLKKVGEKGTNPGPVGSGSGDKAGQTSIDPATKKQFLPQYGKK